MNYIKNNWEIIAGGIFIFILYFTVLKKYNSLGLRLFVLLFLTAGLVGYWLFIDLQKINALSKNETLFNATVIDKRIEHSDQILKIKYIDSALSKEVISETSEYISIEEYNTTSIGDNVVLVLNPTKKELYLKKSLDRFRRDYKYILLFPAALLLIGIVAGIWLRNFKVGVDKKGNEWLENKEGKILLDERTSKTAQVVKKGNIISKLIQLFFK